MKNMKIKKETTTTCKLRLIKTKAIFLGAPPLSVLSHLHLFTKTCHKDQ